MNAFFESISWQNRLLISLLFVFIGAMFAAYKAYKKAKENEKQEEPIIDQVDSLLHNRRDEIRMSALAIKFLITKSLDDANIPRNLLDKYARANVCESHEIGLASDCYIAIYAGRDANAKTYSKVIKNANALLHTITTQIDSPDYVQRDIKITNKGISGYNENQIKKAIKIVKDNLV